MMYLITYTSGLNTLHTRSHMWYLTYQGRSGHKHFSFQPVVYICLTISFLHVWNEAAAGVCAKLKLSTVRKIVCIRIFTLNFKPCIYITVISKILLYSIFSNTWHIFCKWQTCKTHPFDVAQITNNMRFSHSIQYKYLKFNKNIYHFSLNCKKTLKLCQCKPQKLLFLFRNIKMATRTIKIS